MDTKSKLANIKKRMIDKDLVECYNVRIFKRKRTNFQKMEAKVMGYTEELMKALEDSKDKVSVYTSFTTSSCNTTEVKDPVKEGVQMNEESSNEGVA